MKNCFAIITIASLLLHTPIFGQRGQYQFLRFATVNGLSHNRINCILKDSKGFMWFGTMSGLNRYDGYKFRIFRHDIRDSTSLIDNYISRLMEGPDGKLWVETRNGLNIFDPVTETFNRNPLAYLRQLSLPDAFISSIIKDKKGNYWLVHPQYGLFIYTSATRQISRIYHHQKSASGLVENNISSFGEDSKGNFWIIYQDGLIEKMSGQTHAVIYRSSILKDFNKNEFLNYKVFIDAQDELWIHVSGDPRGVFYFKPINNVLLPVNKDSGKIRLNTNIVTGVLQDRQGKIWIGTDHG
jgi:ligand-binding sensor domain-containing protein